MSELGTLRTAMGVDMRPLTLRAGTCHEGPCPNVFDYAPQPDLVAVQGTRLTDPDALAQLSNMPDCETAVLVPRALLLEYARVILAEEALA
jgi:hypothetical protein